METPITAHPPQKRSFIPSVWEKKRVSRLVDLIKTGKLKPLKPRRDPDDPNAEEVEDDMFFELWKVEDEVRRLLGFCWKKRVKTVRNGRNNRKCPKYSNCQYIMRNNNACRL
jgi:hypothetical protein